MTFTSILSLVEGNDLLRLGIPNLIQHNEFALIISGILFQSKATRSTIEICQATERSYRNSSYSW